MGVEEKPKTTWLSGDDGGAFAVVGGALGGSIAAWLSQGQFQPLGQVILAMPRHQQEELTATVMDAFRRDFSDPTALMQMAMADNAIQGALLTCVVTYLRGQGLQVKGA